MDPDLFASENNPGRIEFFPNIQPQLLSRVRENEQKKKQKRLTDNQTSYYFSTDISSIKFIYF